MVRVWMGIAAAMLVACGGPAKAPAVPVDDGVVEVMPLTPDTSPLGLRRSVVADEWFWLRAKALEGEAPAPFGDALAAMRDLRDELSGDPTAWEDLEVPLGSVRNATELRAAYALLPVSKDVGGKVVAFRARALRVSRALEASEKAYRVGPFRDHDAEIAKAARDLSSSLLPNIDAVLRSVETEMALPGVSQPLVVTLVSDAPYPGIFAADARGHAAASFVRVRGLGRSELCEAVLHESLHAIDELTVRLPTAMNTLRGVLARHGFDESDSNVEMAVNTVTFAEAASLVRRYVDPQHRAMGESGFYTLWPPAKDIVSAWNQRIEGATLDETADRVIKAVEGPAEAVAP